MRGLKVLIIFLLSTSILLISSKEVFAQVVINEISPASGTEWVEIFNPTTETISLQGYSINFGSDGQTRRFCDSDQILSGAYRLYNLTTNWLANDGDITTLLNGVTTIDSVAYGDKGSLSKPSPSQSLTRSPDGTANWVLTDSPSPNGGLISFDCPTPTPTATPTSTPANTPTANPTSTPTPPSMGRTPTPRPTKTPSPTPDYTPGTSGAGDSGNEDTVLGIRDELATATPEGGELGGGKPFPIVAGIVMGLGSVCVVGSGVWFFKIRKGTYNGASEENPPKLS